MKKIFTLHNQKKLSVLFLVSLFFLIPLQPVGALSVDELRAQIEKKRQEKEKIEAENKRLEQQIEQTAKEAKTLQNAVKTLDTTGKKLQNDIKITETKIGSTELSIKKIGIEISEKEKQIIRNKEALGETIRTLNDTDTRSFIEIFLQYKDLNEFWNGIETLRRFQNNVKTVTQELKGFKTDLEGKKKENEEKKGELVDFKGELVDKKEIVEENKQAKSKLLVQTKNKETIYKTLLEKNIELGKKFEQELFQYESQLKIEIDRSRLPTEKSGVVSWPLSPVVITQRFGKTFDSKRLYVSGTHNGIDFRATTGTPVKSILNGVVEGVGNTDTQAGCYSYGRWILIKHPNGLSSLYAHLSNAKVSAGQAVETGEVIGYSGGQPGTSGAGFSTGPHLHLGLYASQGVQIGRYEKSVFCKQVDIPLAGPNAYLDPLAYLPPIP